MSTLSWQKSSYSGEGNNCIELASSEGTVNLRESESPEAVIATTRHTLRTFLEAAKTGNLTASSTPPRER